VAASPFCFSLALKEFEPYALAFGAGSWVRAPSLR
jgi:hypothetical protein